jgi:hypothetical protein
LAATSGHHLSAPDEQAWIDTQGPANQAEHHDCANPNAAAGYSDAASILNPRALRQLIEAHDFTYLSILASKNAVHALTVASDCATSAAF